MTDDNEQPPWTRVLAAAQKAVAALQREFAENDALRRQAAQMVKTAQALARDGLWPRPMPVPTNLAQISQSMNAPLREVGRTIPPDLAVFAPAATAHGTAPSPSIRTSFTASGSIAARKPSISGEGTVEEPKDDLVAKQSVGIGRLVAIALVFIAASGLLGVNPAYQMSVGYYVSVVSAALAIALAIWALPK
jgi:hypothetical protein